MLKRQNRGRHKNRHLLAVHDCLERGTQGHLGFAEAHIAAKESVHRTRLFHIPFDFTHCLQLPVGLFVFETGLKFALPFGVGRKGVARTAAALGIQRD